MKTMRSASSFNWLLLFFFCNILLQLGSAATAKEEILPNGQVGVMYSVPIGQENNAYKLKPGNTLPAGLSVQNGLLRGVPKKSGNFNFAFISTVANLPATVEIPFSLIIK